MQVGIGGHKKEDTDMVWRVTLTSRLDGETFYWEFEDQFMAIGFLLKNFFVGNYSKHEIEFVLKQAQK